MWALRMRGPGHRFREAGDEIAGFPFNRLVETPSTDAAWAASILFRMFEQHA